MSIPDHLLTPRDWQAEALAYASRELGTPEGRRALIEARRYGALADQIDALRRGLTAAHDALLRQRAEVEALRRERDRLASRLAEIEQAESVQGPVWLTDERIAQLAAQTWGSVDIAPQSAVAFARAIEAWMLGAGKQ